jgi:tetratricopeptide (TPR) repeat protein
MSHGRRPPGGHRHHLLYARAIDGVFWGRNRFPGAIVMPVSKSDTVCSTVAPGRHAIPLAFVLYLAACAASEPAADAAAVDDVQAEVVRPEPPPGAQAVSLLGQPLEAPALQAERRAELEHQLDEARADYEQDPDDADALIWLGRRLAYLGEYRAAIDTFTEGIERHPDDARMYRHRGHRYITVRELDRAVRDLSHAAELVRGQPDEVEPDGMPNPHGIPRSTLQSNIWYHLALAHYLKHDFAPALEAWHRALAVSDNDDMHVATADWLYMTYRRLGRADEAARVLDSIHEDMEILENHAYHRRLLMYKGEVPAQSLLDTDEEDAVQLATYGYGVANWYYYNDEQDRARELFERILEGPQWAAFGFIAAEAELAAR